MPARAVRGKARTLDGARSPARVRAQQQMFGAMAVMEWCGVGVVGGEG